MVRVKRTVEAERLRSALLTSISHDLKTPLASVLGAASTLRDLSADLTERATARSARHDHRGIGAAQPLHRQPARHDEARIRRDGAEPVPARRGRDRRQRAAPRRANPGAARGRGRDRRRPADAASSTPCCSSRCCSTCSTMRPNTRPAGTTIRIVGWQERRLRPSPGPRRGRRHSRRRSSSTSSTSSIGRRRRTRCRPGPASAWRSRAASSRRCTGRSARPTAPTGAGPSSRSRCRFRQSPAVGHGSMTAPSLRVLVIDDEPPIRKLLRMGLGTQGHEILEAPNGKAGLELLDQNPDLIILDLGLPDIEGIELLRMIRGRNERVPIVVLSSRGDEAGKVRGARSRRRRLRHKAVRHGRASCADAGRRPASAPGAGRAAGLPGRRPLRRPRAAHRQGGRRRR